MFFMNKFKNRKTKRAVEHTPFLKKIATYQSVSQSVSVCVCEIVKLSGFERPQKSDINVYDLEKMTKTLNETLRDENFHDH
jgi:hypothetical protein